MKRGLLGATAVVAMTFAPVLPAHAEGVRESSERRTVTADGPDPIDQHVGRQLRLRRAQSGMTQTELGAKVGLSFQAVQQYETGENRISASRLYQLARILDVPLAFFFDGLDETARADEVADASDLTRKQASMVLGAYCGIKDPRLRSAWLLIMSRIADRSKMESD
jgi:transcriptional regulator with XRE-family HTH domain